MGEKKATKPREYILVAYMEQLLDEGLTFDGETERDRTLSCVDLNNVRSIFQRLANTLSMEERETLIRFAKSTLKEDCPLL